jgi:hypothetical protein
MRKNLISIAPDAALDRVLAGLEHELVEATDEEIVEAAEELGMNIRMKGSAAFLGVLGSLPKRLEDIFDVEDLRRSYLKMTRVAERALRQGIASGPLSSRSKKRTIFAVACSPETFCRMSPCLPPG